MSRLLETCSARVVLSVVLPRRRMRCVTCQCRIQQNPTVFLVICWIRVVWQEELTHVLCFCILTSQG